MTRPMRTLDGVMAAIRAAKSVAIVCHVSPDGDTVGSALAMRLGLMAMGKQVTLFCQDKIPDILMFLPGADAFCMPENSDKQYDLLLCLDVSDERRMGTCAALLEHAVHTALVDHHGTNTCFCQENFVDGSAPANCLIVYELLQRMGCEITADIALCLAVGLSTDTGHLVYGGFRGLEVSECLPAGELCGQQPQRRRHRHHA